MTPISVGFSGALLAPETLASIAPFSVVTDAAGHIVFFGRSLQKLCPEIKSGDSLHLHLELRGGDHWGREPSPSQLEGRLVLLAPRNREEARGPLSLRGTVSCAGSSHFLFLLQLLVNDLTQLTGYKLNFADFAEGDPIFDFLMLLQSERSAGRRLEAARKQLLAENRSINLLHDLSIELQVCADERSAWRRVLELVCGGMEWKYGRILAPANPGDNRAMLLATWPEANTALVPVDSLVEMDGCREAIDAQKPAWSRDARLAWAHLSGRDPPAGSVPLALAVPIIGGKGLLGVLELAGESSMEDRGRALIFYETMARQLADSLEQQRSRAREQLHWLEVSAASKLSSLGELAAGVAHEVNNPLAAVELGIEQLRELAEEGVPWHHPQATAVMDRMSRSCSRISKIVSSLRSHSRDARADPLVPVLMQQLLDETLVLCAARCRARDIRLELGACPPQLQVLGRQSELSQVLLNLINNAADAVRELPAPWIRVEVAEVDGSRVELAVTDSGSGIPAEVAARIMQPFFTTKPAGQGTGLGLSISSRIMAAHGGGLRLDPASQHTRFVAFLPRWNQ